MKIFPVFLIILLLILFFSCDPGTTNPPAKINYYTLTFTTDPPDTGSVTLQPEKDQYAEGETVIIKAEDDTGYKFVSWGGDISGTVNPYNPITMNGDKSITIGYEECATYTLTLHIGDGNGTIIKEPDQDQYNEGSEITIECIPDFGYSFDTWQEDGVTFSDSESYAFYINDNMTYTANLHELDKYKLALDIMLEYFDPDTDGKIFINPQDDHYKKEIVTMENSFEYYYYDGTNITLQCIPDVGSLFYGWADPYGEAENPYEITMDGDKTLTAVFQMCDSSLATTASCLYQANTAISYINARCGNPPIDPEVVVESIDGGFRNIINSEPGSGSDDGYCIYESISGNDAFSRILTYQFVDFTAGGPIITSYLDNSFEIYLAYFDNMSYAAGYKTGKLVMTISNKDTIVTYDLDIFKKGGVEIPVAGEYSVGGQRYNIYFEPLP